MPTPHLLAIAGELDLQHCAAVRADLAPLLEAKTARLLVDLTGLGYIDSSGLALLIETHQRVEEYGGHLMLFGLRESVRHVFEIARLDRFFTLLPDRAAALAAS